MATIKKPAKKMQMMSKTTKAKNGKSFPDLNKDGKITKADILKGRGVIAKKGMKVKKAQNGDSTKYYYNQSTKDIMNATKAIKEKGSSSKEYDDAFKKQTESLGNLRRQSKKGKPGYDKMGNPVKKNKTGGMTAKKKMNYGGAAASMAPTMKSGGKMTKKCMTGCK
jgi:hypothetical protein